MIDTLNPRITNWILGGKTKEALVGEGTYFVPSNTFHKIHNQSLVLHVLFRVAKNQQQIELYQKQLDDILLKLAHERPDVALATMVGYSVMAEEEYKNGLLLRVDHELIMQEINQVITPEQFSKVTMGATLSEITASVLNDLQFLSKCS